MVLNHSPWWPIDRLPSRYGRWNEATILRLYLVAWAAGSQWRNRRSRCADARAEGFVVASRVGRSVIWGTKFSKGPKWRRMPGALLAAATLLMAVPAHQAMASDGTGGGAGRKVKVIVTSDSVGRAKAKVGAQSGQARGDLGLV